jgi:hypothetical protein
MMLEAFWLTGLDLFLRCAFLPRGHSRFGLLVRLLGGEKKSRIGGEICRSQAAKRAALSAALMLVGTQTLGQQA